MANRKTFTSNAALGGGRSCEVRKPMLLRNMLFPLRLHAMLEAVEESGDDHIVSWLSDCKSFKVHDIEGFIVAILPHFFQQTKYKSFQRQLNMWGFIRILTGPSAGGYSHDLFVRGQEDFCKNMKRIKIKGSPEKRLKPIRCPNTRVFPPPMSSFLKKMTKGRKVSSGFQKESTDPSRNGSSSFFSTSLGSTTMDLFRCDSMDTSMSTSTSSSSLYDEFEIDLASIDPLPIDSWEDGATSCGLLGDLSSLLD